MSATPYRIENHGPRQWRLLKQYRRQREPVLVETFRSKVRADAALLDKQTEWIKLNLALVSLAELIDDAGLNAIPLPIRNLVASERRHLERERA